MAARRRWSSLAARTQRRYASRGRTGGLSGAQQYRWEGLSAGYRRRYDTWAADRGLDPRRVYGDPELRPVAVGQKGRVFRGRTLIDPVDAVRRPLDHEGWLYGHRRLAETVAVSPKGLRAYGALRAESRDVGVPTISLVFPPPGEPVGHISGEGDWASILDYLGGANGAPAASGVVFAIFKFDPGIPFYLWWKDYEK